MFASASSLNSVAHLSPELQFLYQDAESNRPNDEWTATAFINHLLTKEMFPEKHWIIGPEQPAAPDFPSQKRRRVDITIKHLVSGASNSAKLGVLCFIEAKKARASRDDIDDMEEQVHNACSNYCEQEDAPWVYAMCCLGARMRFFIHVQGEPNLRPLKRGDSMALADARAYIDPLKPHNWDMIKSCFQTMKNDPPEAGIGRQAKHARPTPQVSSTAAGKVPIGNILRSEPVEQERNLRFVDGILYELSDDRQPVRVEEYPKNIWIPQFQGNQLRGHILWDGSKWMNQ